MQTSCMHQQKHHTLCRTYRAWQTPSEQKPGALSMLISEKFADQLSLESTYESVDQISVKWSGGACLRCVERKTPKQGISKSLQLYTR